MNELTPGIFTFRLIDEHLITGRVRYENKLHV